MKHERRIRRDIRAIDAEMKIVREQKLPGKIESKQLSDLEAKRGKLLIQLLKEDKHGRS